MRIRELYLTCFLIVPRQFYRALNYLRTRFVMCRTLLGYGALRKYAKSQMHSSWFISWDGCVWGRRLFFVSRWTASHSPEAKCVKSTLSISVALVWWNIFRAVRGQFHAHLWCRGIFLPTHPNRNFVPPCPETVFRPFLPVVPKTLHSFLRASRAALHTYNVH